MVRIVIKNAPEYMPQSMADFDGLYSLDLQTRSKIAITKQIDDYSEPGAIKQDTFKQIDLLVTNKNKLLLGKIGNPSGLNQNNSKVFEVLIVKDDYLYPAQGLQVVESSDLSLSIIVFGELNAWIKPLSNLYLNEIDLGSAVVDFVYMNQLHLNNSVYEDGNIPVFPPLVNYGEWFINSNLADNSTAESQVVFNNYRFWVSPYALLKQAFCQVGHSLIAPFMQTEEFRRHWCYFLDPEFETAMQLDVANRPFEADVTTNVNFAGLFFVFASGATFGGIVNFFNFISDPGSHTYLLVPSVSPSLPYHGFFYNGGIIGNFTFSGVARINIPSGPLTPANPEFITLKASIRKAPKFGINNQQELLDSSTELASETKIRKGQLLSGINYDFEYDISTSNVKVYQHEVVFVVFEYDAFLFDNGGATFTESYLYQYTNLLSGSGFKCNVQKQVLEEGDTVEFGKLLRKDLTALDAFKGIVHLPNMKTETNTTRKEVSIYPEQFIDYFGSGIQEGFFKQNYNESTFEATNKIQVNSLKEGFLNTSLQRNVYLKFANSTDGYIANMNLEEELHSKKVDLGSNYSDGINEITNPIIQPTANGIDKKIGGLQITFGIGDVRNSVNYIPFMWESTPPEEGAYPKIGYNLQPRICIAYDLANNVQTSSEINGQSNFSSSAFVYEDQRQSFYNPFGQIFPEGVTANPFPSQPSIDLNLSVVYGNGVNENIIDYYQFIYEKSIKQAYFAIALNFLVMIDIIDFSNLSFRNKWHLRYNSNVWGQIDIYCRISAVKDYVIGGDITTSIELIPDNNNFICE
jgi:hypothetical protein